MVWKIKAVSGQLVNICYVMQLDQLDMAARKPALHLSSYGQKWCPTADAPDCIATPACTMFLHFQELEVHANAASVDCDGTVIMMSHMHVKRCYFTILGWFKYPLLWMPAGYHQGRKDIHLLYISTNTSKGMLVLGEASHVDLTGNHASCMP